MKLVCPREVQMHENKLVQDVEYTFGKKTGSVYIIGTTWAVGRTTHKVPEGGSRLELAFEKNPLWLAAQECASLYRTLNPKNNED